MNIITEQPIDPSIFEKSLNDPSCGGVITFIGKVRNHHEGRAVLSLSYEAYAPMAQKVFDAITEEATEKFGVKSVNIVHRVGHLEIGDVAVWVGVQSGHRGEVFLACRYAIDELKTRAPIWKKEHYVAGDSHWVACLCTDTKGDMHEKSKNTDSDAGLKRLALGDSQFP